MQVSINKLFLEQTSFDSAAPSGLAAVVHRFSEPGQYVVTFLRDDRVFDRYPLSVLAEPAKPEEPQSQVRVDIGKLRQPVGERPPAEERPPHFTVGAKGYALFTSSRREGSYAIIAEGVEVESGGEPKQGPGKPAPEGRGKPERFDSRRLGVADLFAVTMIRPGTYAVTNTLTGAKGKITVAYPTIGKEAYRPPAALSVHCTNQGFSPGTIDLQPAQGIVFRFSVPSHIKIDMVEPNDGPGRVVGPRDRPGVPAVAGRRPILRWQKPSGRSD